MKRTKSVNFNLSSDLYAKVEEYSKAHEISIEEVIQMALTEYFESGLLLEEKKKRKRIWDIINVPEDDC